MKAIEQYIPVVLFLMLYKVVLTLKSVDETFMWYLVEIPACHHSIAIDQGACTFMWSQHSRNSHGFCPSLAKHQVQKS